MNKYKSFRHFAQTVADLPQVAALFKHHGDTFQGGVILRAIPDALSNAITIWYDSRCFVMLSRDGDDTGFPGNHASFSLALKSAFWKIRYAFPKRLLNDALDAIARAFPGPAEMDSYPELAEKVAMIDKRQRLQRTAAKVETSTDGASLADALEDPTLPAPLRALKQLLRGAPSPSQVTEELAQRDEPPAPPTEDPGFEVDQNPIATPGFECPRGSTIRRGEPVPVPGSITGDLPEDQRADLERALQQLKALLWPDPRALVKEHGDEARKQIANGTLLTWVSEMYATAPKQFLTDDATQLLLRALQYVGYGDVVSPLINAVRLQPGHEDFVIWPASGSEDDKRLTAAFERMRVKLGWTA